MRIFVMGDDSTKDAPHFMRRYLYSSRCVHIAAKRWKLMTAVLLCLLFIAGWRFYNELHDTGSKSADVKTVSPSKKEPPAAHVEHASVVAAGNNGRLFYNRVPKCGSSTLVSLLKKLAVRNGFTHVQSPLLDEWSLFMPAQQEAFVKDFVQNPVDTSFDRHLFFLDFERYNEENPIYINMIRDPTERFISEFYFRRRLQNEGVKQGEKKWYDEDLDNCIRTGKDYDCRLVEGTFLKNMIAFFCGHEMECSRHGSRHALERAKEKVEKHFAVVGILEDLDMTLSVLEQKLPRYFAGVMDLWSDSNSDGQVVNKGRNRRQDVSPETKEIIRANLTIEYQFYDFIKNRLISQSRH
ncbi:hypothetical protein RvY_13920 [Ramazzottius varieornatus]|uniref:Sulfotransferase domain-containing protein n=1 Tax=Ramazzottius varieornatus TaxID=947166 RepID=A0A1D1VRB6_RAMVA|nr:hypothetical protein RvY_13920 [Ramazzottius varieornatus]